MLSQGRQSSVCTGLPRDESESSICDTARIYWQQGSSSGCYRRTGPEWHKDDEEGENARGYTGNSRPPNVTAAEAGSSLPRSLDRASLSRATEEFPGDGRLPEGATAGRVRREVGEGELMVYCSAVPGTAERGAANG